jgi:hypothetical protein
MKGGFKMKEKLCKKIAWILPRSIVKWCYFRVLAHATQGKWSKQVVPDLTWQQAADRWEQP